MARHRKRWWSTNMQTVVVDVDPDKPRWVISAPARFWFDPGIIGTVPNPHYDRLEKDHESGVRA